MTKPELGTKRACASCGAKFYDLNKTPITCPKCGTLFEVVPMTTRPRPDQRAAARKLEIAAEEAKARAAAEDPEAPEDAETKEIIEDDAETPFIAAEEDGDTDVSEIIGGDVKDDDDT